MQKLLLGALGAIVVLVLAVLGAAASRPDHLHIERSATFAAAPQDLVPQVSDLEQWSVWNPWKDYDPAMKTTYSDTKAGVGAWYEWWGNDDVGHGKLTVLTVEDTKVTQDLEFFEPWQSKALITFAFTPDGEGTKVTWSMDEDQQFMGKVMGLFMDMDAMLGADFEKGLAKLQPIAEKSAATRKEADAAAAAAPPVDPEAPVDPNAAPAPEAAHP